MQILFYDIETAPLLAYIWQPDTRYVNKDMLDRGSFMLAWSARWAGENRTYSEVLTGAEAVCQDDGRILVELADLMRDADVVVAHNGDRFDLPVINARLLKWRAQPLGPIKTIDTLALAQRNFRLPYHSLDYLAEYLGFEGKKKPGFQTWRECYAGYPKALADMSRYNRKDVEILENVFEAMKPYVKGLPRLVDALEDGEQVCPYCGSDHLIKRGYHRTNASTFQRYECKDCGRYSRAKGPMKDKRLGVAAI